MILKWITEEEGDPKERWHDWFAWFPVTAYDDYTKHYARVWLQYVRRRGTYKLYYEGGGYEWEYTFSSFGL